MAIAQSLDHFVVPVDDIVVAEDFYEPVFGGILGKRNGLNVRQRKRGAAKEPSADHGGLCGQPGGLRHPIYHQWQGVNRNQ